MVEGTNVRREQKPFSTCTVRRVLRAETSVDCSLEGKLSICGRAEFEKRRGPGI